MTFKLLSIRSEIPSLGFLDGDIVGTHVTPTHEPVLLELPQLISMRPKPLSGLIAPLVLEAHGNVVVREGPELLHQSVVVLLRPFACEKLFDGVPALEKLRAVAPLRVLGVRQRHHVRVPGVPGRFRGLHFRQR